MPIKKEKESQKINRIILSSIFLFGVMFLTAMFLAAGIVLIFKEILLSYIIGFVFVFSAGFCSSILWDILQKMIKSKNEDEDFMVKRHPSRYYETRKEAEAKRRTGQRIYREAGKGYYIRNLK